ncbi:hypothetical protein BC834DRAFT_893969 [Gloeopeniophorella convolvens]|nr:hypothetical protein BC834DRAFT_893969 [Gloeopeniophorella convolvens]
MTPYPRNRQVSLQTQTPRRQRACAPGPLNAYTVLPLLTPAARRTRTWKPDSAAWGLVTASRRRCARKTTRVIWGPNGTLRNALL